MYSLINQWYSTWGTSFICDTLTKKFWHFAFIFTWHFWRKDVKKMTPWQTQRAKYEYTCQAISPVYCVFYVLYYTVYCTYIVNVHDVRRTLVVD